MRTRPDSGPRDVEVEQSIAVVVENTDAAAPERCIESGIHSFEGAFVVAEHLGGLPTGTFRVVGIARGNKVEVAVVVEIGERRPTASAKRGVERSIV